jgi:diketogulonate reductase-like aldo/keto reductase
VWGAPVKKNVEEQIKVLFARHSIPPLEVIIPILEKTGKGEQELTAQVYDTYKSLIKGIKEILGFKDNDMKTVAKVWEIVLGFDRTKFQPIELTESRFSFSIPDCPMIHVGKDVSFDVKSKFCDLICTAGSKALMDAVLSPNRSICNWNKALIKGANKCTVTFELVKTR